jgi:thioredoxin 1
MVQAITSLDSFKEHVNSGKKIAIDFWAEWCGPCKAISPVYEGLESKYPDIAFFKVDVDNCSDISEEVGIRAMPTFMTFQNGEKTGEIVGASPQKLTALIEMLASA